MTKALSSIPGYLIYALLVFTPLARASVQGWAITTIHMVTLIALTAFVLEKTVTGNWKWITTPLDKPILILLILSILSSVFSMHFRTSLWAMAVLVNYIIIFYLVIHTVRTRTELRHLIYLIIGIATFLSVFGLFKRLGFNPFPWWNYPDIKQTIPGLTSTYGNYNHLAGYMEMAIPLLLGLFLFGYRRTKVFFLVYLLFFLLTALLLTLSRGGWIGAFVGLAFMAVALLTNRHFKKKKLVAALTGGFFGVALIVLASTPVVERIRTLEKQEGLAARVTVWGGMVDMIQDHPLLGTGPGTFATVFTQYQPVGYDKRYFMGHNDYLHFTSELGLFLAAIVVWMIIGLYRKGFQKLRDPSRLVRGVTVGAMSGITAILVHSIVDFNLHIPANAILFTVLAALVIAPTPMDNPSPLRQG